MIHPQLDIALKGIAEMLSTLYANLSVSTGANIVFYFPFAMALVLLTCMGFEYMEHKAAPEASGKRRGVLARANMAAWVLLFLHWWALLYYHILMHGLINAGTMVGLLAKIGLGLLFLLLLPAFKKEKNSSLQERRLSRVATYIFALYPALFLVHCIEFPVLKNIFANLGIALDVPLFLMICPLLLSFAVQNHWKVRLAKFDAKSLIRDMVIFVLVVALLSGLLLYSEQVLQSLHVAQFFKPIPPPEIYDAFLQEF